jgi:hypothetical protein
MKELKSLAIYIHSKEFIKFTDIIEETYRKLRGEFKKMFDALKTKLMLLELCMMKRSIVADQMVVATLEV